MQAFLSRHEPKVTAVLDCFDRIVFQGHLPFNYPEAMVALASSAVSSAMDMVAGWRGIVGSSV
jgi:hypothetical protein